MRPRTAWLGALLLGGCDYRLVSVQQQPVAFVPAAGCAAPFVLGKTLYARLDGVGVASSAMPAGSHWHCVGRTPQGAVFASDDAVVTVAADDMYEARPVLRGDVLVGFYLPVEQSFAAARDTPKLNLRKETP